MIVEVARRRANNLAWLSIRVEPRLAKTFVGVLVVRGEVKVALNQERTGESIIADAIAAHPRVKERQRNDQQKKKYAWRELTRIPRLGI